MGIHQGKKSTTHLDIHWEGVESHVADEGDPDQNGGDFHLAGPDDHSDPDPDQNVDFDLADPDDHSDPDKYGNFDLADPDENCGDFENMVLLDTR